MGSMLVHRVSELFSLNTCMSFDEGIIIDEIGEGFHFFFTLFPLASVKSLCRGFIKSLCHVHMWTLAHPLSHVISSL